MPKISIIVPIYGVEKYIERCARSLFEQTMDDLEFIFVNDCTYDSSMSILERIVGEYPNRNVRIVNHPRNMGVSYARKSGLGIATGDYIIHCDSDDWVEPEYCRKLYVTAVAENSDIVVCDFILDEGEGQVGKNDYDDAILINPLRAVSASISLRSSPFLWNKLVRREIYENHIIHPNNNLADDWTLTVQFIYYSKKTAIIADKLYHYCYNPNSIIRDTTKDACFKRCAEQTANVTLINTWLKEKGLLKKYKRDLIKPKIVAKGMLMPVIMDPQASLAWRRTFPEVHIPVLFGRGYGKRYKIRFLLLAVGLYRPIKKVCKFV